MKYPSDEQFIVYDGDCPFCANYVKLQQLRRNIGLVNIINAREGGVEVVELKRLGFDLDEGMVLVYRGEVYHGDACIHMLALLSDASNPLSRFIAWLFRSRSVARVLYPVMRAGRNFTLRLMNRRRLDGRKF